MKKTFFIFTILFATLFVLVACTNPSGGSGITIEKPVLLSPENNASELLAPVTLEWTGALESYTVLYSNSFIDLRGAKGEATDVNETNTELDLPDGTWFWKVKGEKNGIETAYTEIRSFSIGFDAPPAKEEDAEATVTASLSDNDEITLSWPEYKSENYEGDTDYYEYYDYAEDAESGLRSNDPLETATCSTNNATFVLSENINRLEAPFWPRTALICRRLWERVRLAVTVYLRIIRRSILTVPIHPSARKVWG